eukprot:NODE_101_length_2156_cov_130.728999_g74_i0.p1 GENE.NODE_101_length_2156_cov_130.728999_g74_i0~~NODE_101_length_2156_cov_130.728999_g74_i0.p1  ORF type:complete len:624 (+),score=171.87 NODE_101_length_2156_cov_130.728999_g74_i0:73-1944(+)
MLSRRVAGSLSRVASPSTSRLGSTFAHQDKLPPLPVPELNETCDKYIKWVAPILSADEHARTSQLVKEFASPSGVGPKLHAALLEWAKDKRNWLEPFWDDMYLGDRGMQPIHVSYTFMMNPIPLKDPLDIAAALISSSIRFKKLLDEESLEPDKDKDGPVSMDQYRKLFSACRIPLASRDQLRLAYCMDNASPAAPKHVVVIRKGRLYTLDVYNPDGTFRSYADIKADLEKIVAAAGTKYPPREQCFCLMTAGEREHGARIRQKILDADPKNHQVLDDIERSLFAVSLDDNAPETFTDAFNNSLSGEMRNRFYDKQINMIVYANGVVSWLMEHSGMDGHTVIRLFRHVFQDIHKGMDALRAPVTGGKGAPQTYRELMPVLNDDIKQLLIAAGKQLEGLKADTQVSTLEFTDFGADRIKTFKLSPDGFVQAMFHLSQLRLRGKIGSTYESCMTKKFYHGRTETLRTVSPEVKAFAEAVLANAPREEQIKLLTAAVNEHSNRGRMCANGRGVDRHLWGMKQIWIRQGSEMGIAEEPAIFKDPAFSRMRTDILSTSALGDPALKCFGFGPTADTGFGIGYSVHPQQMNFMLTSRVALGSELDRFIELLRASFREFADVLSSASAKL